MIKKSWHSVLAETLKTQGTQLVQKSVVAGFDGFVDEMISVVNERRSLTEWSGVSDISRFGDLIKSAAGRSSAREIMVHQKDPGGCAVNMGDGLTALGVSLDIFATLGNPIHPAFLPFTQSCHSFTAWGSEPGRTLAFEFSDGKLMFCHVSQLADLNDTWLDGSLKDGCYLQACQNASLIALTNWSLFPHMTSVWKKLQSQIYSKLTHRPRFFFDLVDPSGRSTKDILEMLGVLSKFEDYGSVVLGVNGNEANVLSRILGLDLAGESVEEVKCQACALRQKLGLQQVVIHLIKMAVVSTVDGVWSVFGPHCPNPKKSTGAGDRFNAGYAAGLLLNLSPELCLGFGCMSSGFFVRHARSAKMNDLVQFCESEGA